MIGGSALGVAAQLIAHEVVGERVLHGLEEAVGQDQHHVVDASGGDDLGQERFALAAVISGEQLADLLYGQITLEINYQMITKVGDETVHSAEIPRASHEIKAPRRG